MEAAVNGLGYTPEEDGVLPVQIPFRDDEEGWEDWPPIFTPQYAAFHGAVSHTVEIPLRVNNADYERLPIEELRRRSAINTDVAEAAVRAAVRLVDHLIANDVEVHRLARPVVGTDGVRYGRLLRRGHAPGQAGPGQRHARGRCGHQRGRRRDVRHLRMEPPPAVGGIGGHRAGR